MTRSWPPSDEFTILLRLKAIQYLDSTGMAKQPVLHVSNKDRLYLTQVVNSRTFPAGDTFRARLILALAEGQS
jgi:hypothetical protein